jgi:hypothetical protein
MGGSTHSRSSQRDRHLMSDWARTPARNLFTSRNEQFEQDHDPCPGALNQDKQGVGTKLLVRKEIVGLLLETAPSQPRKWRN